MTNIRNRIVGATGFVAILIMSVDGLGDDRLNFNRDIRPLLSDRCFACHGPDKNARKADLRLDRREVAVERKAIVPGNPSQSVLIERIFSTDPDVMMPPSKLNKPLTTAERDLLKRWIVSGAEYRSVAFEEQAVFKTRRNGCHAGHDPYGINVQCHPQAAGGAPSTSRFRL